MWCKVWCIVRILYMLLLCSLICLFFTLWLSHHCPWPNCLHVDCESMKDICFLDILTYRYPQVNWWERAELSSGHMNSYISQCNVAYFYVIRCKAYRYFRVLVCTDFDLFSCRLWLIIGHDQIIFILYILYVHKYHMYTDVLCIICKHIICVWICTNIPLCVPRYFMFCMS